MRSTVGIFSSQTGAKVAVEKLLEVGVARESIIFLGSDRASRLPEQALENVPTTDAERDGMGKAIGALLGGTVGASAGLAGGAAVASLLVPGVGTIFAVGLGAAAVLGLGGAAAGAKAGDVTEHAMDVGVPKDDMQFYRVLLKHGYSLVIANVDSEEMSAKAEAIFKEQGSEDVETARKELKAA